MEKTIRAKFSNEVIKPLEKLALEAESDSEESYSSRAAAMTALTRVISDLTKSQEEVINMERLMRIESITIETLQAHLTPEQQEKFLEDLEERLNA